MHASPISSCQREVAELFACHAPFVRRLLRRFGVRDADVADACQDVFLVVQRKLPEFEQRAAHRTWIFRISVRVASDYRKRAHRRYERFGDAAFCEHALERGAAQVAGEPADRELTRRALRALAALDEDKRRAFVLHELEELTMAEVAAALGCPLKTAFSRFYAARRALQAELRRGLPWAGGWLLWVWPRKLPASLRAALEHGAQLDPGGLGVTGGALASAGASGLLPALCSVGAALALTSVVAVHERAPTGPMLVADEVSARSAFDSLPVLTPYADLAPQRERAPRREPAPAPPARPRKRATAVPADRATALRPHASAPAAEAPRASEWLAAPARASTPPAARQQRAQRPHAGLDEVLAVTSIRSSLRLGPRTAHRWALLPR